MKAIEYGSHSGEDDHLSHVRKMMTEDVRKNRCSVFYRKAAPGIRYLRVAPMGGSSHQQGQKRPRFFFRRNAQTRYERRIEWRHDPPRKLHGISAPKPYPNYCKNFSGLGKKCLDKPVQVDVTEAFRSCRTGAQMPLQYLIS